MLLAKQNGSNVSTLLLVLSLLCVPCLVSSFVCSGEAGRKKVRREMTQKIAAVAEVTEDTRSTTALVNKATSSKRVAILICPAQFCVPVDYQGLIADIEENTASRALDDPNATIIGPCKVAPLPRTEWIKVARNVPTRSFIESTLPVYKTLDWYFHAMEDALSDIFAEGGEDVNLCIIGHSIGGWVARAYLGGLSASSTSVCRLAQQRCTSLITLGTPHSSPDGALVDQTRGLLKEVESTSSCAPKALADRGIEVTCVGGAGLSGKIVTADVEEFVAATSYLPLLGKLGKDIKGDGIVPSDLAFMDAPARRIEVENCDLTGRLVRHAHVFPTPWNLIDGSAPSLPLPDNFAWYGSPGVIGQWVHYIR